jgi:hypothetical protein
MRKIGTCVFVLTGVIFMTSTAIAQSKNAKPRTVVTTDGEVDDQDSFIRLLLYANEFNIEGLVYSSSQWHYKGDGKGTKFTSEIPMTEKRYGEKTELRWPGTTWMEEMIGRYKQVYPSLSTHDKNFPSPDYLLSIVKIGNIDFEGEMAKDTEGSDFIKKLLLDSKPGPIYLQIWGGTNTVARALKSIEDESKSKPNWARIKKGVSEKAVIYAVLDQDATYKKYIASNWPEIKVLYNANQFWNFAYPWPRVVPAELQSYLRGPWFKENIKTGHGPLLEAYYLWGDGTQIQNDEEHTQGNPAELEKNKMTQYDFISEGDSPAFFHLVDVGLRNMEDASYGGWGGRMVRSTNPYRWEDGEQATDFNPFSQKMDKAYPQTRWIDVLQNDFAARADWCVKGYNEANHAPTVTLGQSNNLKAAPGETINLSATATDPDKNKVNFKWWQYFEVDSFGGTIELKEATSSNSSFVVPADAKKGETIHVIVEGMDDGSPALTRYQRVIVTVK